MARFFVWEYDASGETGKEAYPVKYEAQTYRQAVNMARMEVARWNRMGKERNFYSVRLLC